MNKGYSVALATLGGGRIGIAAQALGIAQAALEAAVRYAASERQFDRPIGEFDAIRQLLADMAVEVERGPAPHVPGGVAARSGTASREGGLARQVARLRGGDARAHIRDPGARRLWLPHRVRWSSVCWRDARITEIYEGTTEVQKMVVAAQVLEGARDRRRLVTGGKSA